MQETKVSVVIPTFKRPDFLARLLAAIQQQTFQSFEVIVVDDNSPNFEEYFSVYKTYAEVFPEFHLLRNQENKGAPFSRNRGILASKYDLIALVDDDDEWLPTKLEKQIGVFSNSSEKVGLIYTWTDSVDEDNNVVHKYRSTVETNLKREILKECFIPSPSVMVRKSAIIAAGLFDEKLPSCQDWDMWTRIIMKGYGVKSIKEVLTIYHKHSSGSIGLSKNAKKGYRMYYLKNLKNCIFYWKLIPRFVRSLLS